MLSFCLSRIDVQAVVKAFCRLWLSKVTPQTQRIMDDGASLGRLSPRLWLALISARRSRSRRYSSKAPAGISESRAAHAAANVLLSAASRRGRRRLSVAAATPNRAWTRHSRRAAKRDAIAGPASSNSRMELRIQSKVSAASIQGMSRPCRWLVSAREHIRRPSSRSRPGYRYCRSLAE
jgi:hypothetical protein